MLSRRPLTRGRGLKPHKARPMTSHFDFASPPYTGAWIETYVGDGERSAVGIPSRPLTRGRGLKLRIDRKAWADFQVAPLHGGVD